jgi:hypothetical protein
MLALWNMLPERLQSAVNACATASVHEHAYDAVLANLGVPDNHHSRDVIRAVPSLSLHCCGNAHWALLLQHSGRLGRAHILAGICLATSTFSETRRTWVQHSSTNSNIKNIGNTDNISNHKFPLEGLDVYLDHP